MYKKFFYTCTAIVPLIKPLVWWYSRYLRPGSNAVLHMSRIECNETTATWNLIDVTRNSDKFHPAECVRVQVKRPGNIGPVDTAWKRNNSLSFWICGWGKLRQLNVISWLSRRYRYRLFKCFRIPFRFEELLKAPLIGEMRFRSHPQCGQFALLFCRTRLRLGSNSALHMSRIELLMKLNDGEQRVFLSIRLLIKVHLTQFFSLAKVKDWNTQKEYAKFLSFWYL